MTSSLTCKPVKINCIFHSSIFKKEYWHKFLLSRFKFPPHSSYCSWAVPIFINTLQKWTVKLHKEKKRSWGTKSSGKNKIYSEKHSEYSGPMFHVLWSALSSVIAVHNHDKWSRPIQMQRRHHPEPLSTCDSEWLGVIFCSAVPRRPLIYFSKPAHTLHTSTWQHLSALWYTDGKFPSFSTLRCSDTLTWSLCLCYSSKWKSDREASSKAIFIFKSKVFHETSLFILLVLFLSIIK